MNDLKLLAEWMGWKPVSYMTFNGVTTETMPNPLMDDSKMVEIMEKLQKEFLELRFRVVQDVTVKMGSTVPDDNYYCELIHSVHEYMDIDSKGKTINEAVVNAAIARIKQ